MAEIKSTLELVMERTRNMVFSEGEKREQDVAEFAKSVSGLIQKVLDGLARIEEFKKELERLGRGVEADPRRVAIREVARRLRLEGDNGPLLDMLGGPCRADTSEIVGILRAFMDAIEKTSAETSSRLLSRLASGGVSGSAVTPNVEKDPEWPGTLESIREAHQAMLDREIERLGTA